MPRLLRSLIAQLLFVVAMITSNVMVIKIMTSVQLGSAAKVELVVVADTSPVGTDDHRASQESAPLTSSPIDLTDEDIAHHSAELIRPSISLVSFPFYRTSLRSAFDTHFLESIPRRGADRPPDSRLT